MTQALANVETIDRGLVQECRQTMKKGSLSFFFASRLLAKNTREGIFLLYAWCRYCDDVIDLDVPSLAHLSLDERLQLLKQKTEQAYILPSAVLEHPAFRGMQCLAQSFDVPVAYPLALLEGMRMDVSSHTYHDSKDLDRYCYHVAGVVGLMSCHLMGLTDEKGLKYADSLGRAMQLTNIARDIREDAERGRVYIPESWCRELGVDHSVILEQKRMDIVAKLAKRLVDTAEPLYEEGTRGLQYLGFRSALAVAAARYIYAEIGHEVVRRGESAWDQRTWIPLNKKIILAAKAIFHVVKSLPLRWRQQRHFVRIREVRQYS